LQALLQQRPSTQKPLAHPPLPSQGCPWDSTHWPAPLHVLTPLHASDCAPPGTCVQVPALPATLHISHVPHRALAQHTPSTQLPFAHAAPASHVVPGHDEPLQHTPCTHEPVAHSLQLPEAQSVPGLHDAPAAFDVTHAPPDAQ
jgi:hypothetical protein